MAFETVPRWSKMVDLHRITILADVVRQERIVRSVRAQLVRLAASVSADERRVVETVLTELGTLAELCATEQESLREMDKVLRAANSESR